jgi:hypothetical protein
MHKMDLVISIMLAEPVEMELILGFGGETLFGIENTEKFSWNASYGYVNATYDSDLELTSDANSSRTTSTTSYNSYDDESLIDE